MPTKLKSTGVEFPDNTTQTTEGVTSITAGNALTGGGSGDSVTIDHEDTSSQGSVSNSDSDVIQSVTLDDFGHVTGLSSTSISAGGVGTRERLNGSGTFTVPSGIEKIRVFIVGGGGGGGSSHGGGGGGLNVQDINTSPGATFSYSSGSGGSGRGTGGAGGDGGSSSFGSFSAGGGTSGTTPSETNEARGGSGGGSGCDGNGGGDDGGGSGGFGGGGCSEGNTANRAGADGGGGGSQSSNAGPGGDGFIVVEY